MGTFLGPRWEYVKKACFMQSSISPALSHKLANMGFVCACLVVFIHLRLSTPEAVEPPIRYFLGSGICSIAVPFFFIASGYFLAGHTNEQGWWPREFGKRIHTLLIPYLCWSLIAAGDLLFRYLLKTQLLGIAWEHESPFSASQLLRIFGLYPLDHPLLVPLWYVRCLLLFLCITPLLNWILSRTRTLGLICLATFFCLGVTIGALHAAPDSMLPFWQKCFALGGLFYFSLGLFLRHWPIRLALPRVAAGALLVVAFSCYTLNMWGTWTNAWWTPYPRFIAIPIALLAVWRLIPSCPWPRWLTGLSFPLFLIHYLVIGLYQTLQGYLLPLSTALPPTLNYLTQWIVATGVSILLALAMKKYCPRISAVLFGGR